MLVHRIHSGHVPLIHLQYSTEVDIGATEDRRICKLNWSSNEICIHILEWTLFASKTLIIYSRKVTLVFLLCSNVCIFLGEAVSCDYHEGHHSAGSKAVVKSEDNLCDNIATRSWKLIQAVKVLSLRWYQLQWVEFLNFAQTRMHWRVGKRRSINHSQKVSTKTCYVSTRATTRYEVIDRTVVETKRGCEVACDGNAKVWH